MISRKGVRIEIELSKLNIRVDLGGGFYNFRKYSSVSSTWHSSSDWTRNQRDKE